MARNNGDARIILDREDIVEEIDLLGLGELYDRILKSSNETEYLLIEKLITFADVVGYGKCCNYSTADKNNSSAYKKKTLEERAKKNYLFYKTEKEIVKIEKSQKNDKVFFNQTKQSNIHLPIEFYSFIGRLDSREENDYDLNSGKVHCYLVNSSISGKFTKDITNDTLEKLNREKKAKDIRLFDGEFTNISLHVKVHGIGGKEDEVFRELRGNVFATDKICLLLERTSKEVNIFISFFRNPIFYKLNNLMMSAYLLTSFEKTIMEKEPEESRRGQAKWRDTLAEYSISIEDGDVDYVICPFTNTKVRYPSEATLLRASHIKAYKKCRDKDKNIDVTQAYDVDNGFLVTANVDALFDKYLITVDYRSGKIIKSKVISDELWRKLGIEDKLSKKYYESKREYLKVHNDDFNEKERKRK